MRLALLLSLLVACGRDEAEGALDATWLPTADFVVGGDRPATVHVPDGFDPGRPTPLVILLHGRGSSGAGHDGYLGLSAAARARGILLVSPDGTVGADGLRFWNATDACCDFAGSGVDDSSYLAALIDEIAGRVAVDPARVFVVGHSNGGFMAYRMACDHAPRVAAIVSLAGATFADASRCAATQPVSVLEIHGSLDGTVLYQGGVMLAPYPGAVATVAFWGERAGCAPELGSLGSVDVDRLLPGEETSRAAHAGCPAGRAAELWTIVGGGHIPTLATTFADDILSWLLAHPRE